MDRYKKIIHNEENLLSAFKRKDLELLDELFHDECLLILPNGITVTKKDVIASYRTGNTVMTSLTASDQTIQFAGENAMVSVEISLVGKYFEQAIDARYRYLRVWKLVNGAWKIIAGSGMEIKQKQAE